MTDSYARSITCLRLSVTDRCNFRCRYCMPAEDTADHSTICSAEELVEIARHAAACGIRKIRLTGGEPLIRPDILPLCRAIANLPGIESLCLTTNGSLLSGLARPLREAGVDRLNISLDTLRAERFAALTRRGRLEDVLQGLRAAWEAGFSGLKLNVVLLRGVNDDELADFAALTQDHPLEVRFIELMPIGEGDRSRFLPASAVPDACPSLTQVPEPPGAGGVAQRWRLPGGKGMVGLISPLTHRFCDRCDRIRVTADGALKPCLHGAEEISLRGLSGEELQHAIRAGIAAKPLCHHLTEKGRSETARRMNQIGG